MRQSSWKDTLKTFFRADVLRESEKTVAAENIRMLCVLDLIVMCLSAVLWIYTFAAERTDYAGEWAYALFFLAALCLFFFTHKIARSHPGTLPWLITVSYLLWVCYFVVENILCRSDIYITSYYVLIGIVMCFLIKPVYSILLQAFSCGLIIVCICVCKQPEYVMSDVVNAVAMFILGLFASFGTLYYRMLSLRKFEEREHTINVAALYQSIVDEAQTGVYVRELGSYELRYLNRKAREIFGVAETDATGEKCYRLFYHQEVACPECPAKYRNMDQVAPREVLLGGHYYAVKGRIIDWCGREAYVEYLTDITETKLAGGQMRAAHEKLQKKYEEELLYREKASSEDVYATSRLNLTQGIVEEMRVGRTDGYEKQYRHEMDFRVRAQAFARKNWLTDEQNRRLSAEYLRELYEKGETGLSEEYIAELLEGRHVWIKTEVRLVRRPETSEVMAFIYNRDITKENLQRHVLECIMSYEFDEIYVVDRVNGRFSAMAIGQYAMEEQLAVGDYSEELACLKERAVSKEDKEKLEQEISIPAMERQLILERTRVLEVTLLSRNGKPRRKQLRYQYLNRGVGIFLITITDIEDMVKQEKEKQEQLSKALLLAREANQAKSRFLARMSHEIRTPMNAIIGLNAIIREEIDNRAQVLDCTEKLDSASKYLLALLNDVLDMSQIESGSMQLLHQPFDSDKFWENVNILAKTQADLASVNYVFERKSRASGVYVGDATRLQQIMINLINNAVKFTPGEGEVRVEVSEHREADGRALVRAAVADTGIGIAKEFLPKVFDMFAQQYSQSTTTYKGSGLGLSIARNFARMMDGDITVESTEGAGTTFTVEVRLDIGEEKPAVPQSVTEETERDFTGKKVLLVEDHPLNTLVAQNLLTKRGIEVTHAGDGEEALRIFSESGEGSFDAILMDIRMPVMDGIEATVRIRGLEREDAKTIPIIAMTANAYEEDRRRTENAGMNAHLAKPIEPKLLFAALDQFIKE